MVWGRGPCPSAPPLSLVAGPQGGLMCPLGIQQLHYNLKGTGIKNAFKKPFTPHKPYLYVKHTYSVLFLWVNLGQYKVFGLNCPEWQPQSQQIA